MSDAYVLPIDHGAVARVRRVLVIVTVLQVGVAVVVPALIGFVASSVGVAVFAYLIVGAVLGWGLRKDPQRWRTVRAVTEHPPVLAEDGLRLRAAATSGYDLLVPWPQVSRIVATAHGQHWNLVVHIDDPGTLAALRTPPGPPGGPARYRIGFVAADLAELDEVVGRLSGGRLRVDPGTS